LTLALIVTLLLLPQVALGQDSASSPRTDAPLHTRRDEGADETVAPLLSTDTVTPAGIYGQVTYQGNPIEGISLKLYRCDYTGAYWLCSTLLYTDTQSDGSYQFTGAPSLGIDQKYMVEYRNSLHDPNYMLGWWGADIFSYTVGSAVAGGSFDIANISLMAPADDVTVTLPYTFQWIPRTATPTDTYEFELMDGENERTWIVPVSHAGSHTLEILPLGFISGTQYMWNVRANGPDGGYGVAYTYRTITILGPAYELPHTVYLPIVTATKPPSGINGRITYQGNPVSGINLDLRFFNGSSLSTKASAKTQSDGTYQFSGIFSLQANQKYYVFYRNVNASNPNYLIAWLGPDITSYRAGTSVAGGNVDIANIPLVSPIDGATVALPYTLQWTRRTTTLSDSYGVWMEGIVGYESFDSGPLGYVNDYTLRSLPPAFSVGAQYYWGALLYTPDGGKGYSYEHRTVTFSSAGLQAAISQPHSPSILDLERLLELREARTHKSAPVVGGH
jgi:hypothetical protein